MSTDFGYYRVFLFLFSLQFMLKGANQQDIKIFDYAYLFNVDSIEELNIVFEKKFATFKDGKQMINVQFAYSSILHGSIDLRNYTINYTLELNLKFFKGFYADALTPIIMGPQDFLDFELLRSRLDFYDRKGSVLDSTCESYLMSFYNITNDQYKKANKTELLMNYRGIFSISLSVLLLSGDVAFGNRICPIAFKGAYIKSFQVFFMQNTLISRNVLEFVDMTESFPPDYHSGCQIDTMVYLMCYRITLDKYTLNKQMFRYTSSIQVQGVIEAISDDAFLGLIYLKKVSLSIPNLNSFIHSSINKWLGGLNFGVDYDPELWFTASDSNKTLLETLMYQEVILYIESKPNEYQYPDEDFCLFQYIPHRQLVLPLIAGFDDFHGVEENDYLSCTLVFLSQYSIIALNHTYNYSHLNGSFIYPEAFSQKILECELAKRLEMCSINDSTWKMHKLNKKLNVYDAVYILQWIELVGPIVTFPIVSFLGFTSNLLVALVLRSKTNQNELFKGKRMYEYMFANSLFNMAECFLSIFTLMGECLGLNSVFCSAVMNNFYFANFKIYVIQYIGECLKTCSLLTMLSFSIERYISTDSNMVLKSYLKKFTRLKLNRLICSFILLSLLTCAFKVFELKTDAILILSIEYPEFNILNMRKRTWFVVLYVFHYVLNDGVFLFINVIVDIKLFLLIKRDLSLKKSNLVIHDAKSRAKKLEGISKTDSNINKLVIYTFILYLFCRLPELVYYLHLLFILDYSLYSFDYYSFCIFSMCSLQMNIIQYLYTISYLTNILFYAKFNKPFRIGLRRLCNLE